MPTITETCDAVATVLSSISGLRAVGYADDNIQPPQCHVFTREYDPRMIMGNGKRTYALGVRLFVRRADPRAAHIQLRKFMDSSGSTSIITTLEDESAWGVTVDYCEVTAVGAPFEVETPTEIFLAVDFDVDVCW